MSQEQLEHAKALLEAGQLAEALSVTRPLADDAEASLRALAIHATVLKALGRREDALAYDRRALAKAPNNGVVWHNLGATLGDLGRGPEAAEALRTALQLGTTGALTWSALARAEMAAGNLDAAEGAYGEALARAPGKAEFAIELADLMWMRRGDLAGAQALLDRTAHAGGPPGQLLKAKAKLFETAGDANRGADLLALAADRLPDDVSLLLASAQAELERGDLAGAERRLQRAERQLPDMPGVLNQAAIINLALGRPDVALAKARRGLDIFPEDQSLWGWAATAARAVGDPLYGRLYDYDAVVGVYDIETPPGWPSLDAYLKDLAQSLDRIHQFREHPTAQSLRHGSQILHRLTGSDDPAVRAFFAAADAPIRKHIKALGTGDDALRTRSTGDYRIEGAWSVRLRPGGYHKDHFHPEGWLSSAFYVETPEAALDSSDRQGWLRFGRPPFATQPPMNADHHVRPKPGRLVLFPSYMWHGTVPFHTDERRMTIAFDMLPK